MAVLPNVDKIRAALNAAETLKTSIRNYHEAVKSQRCDKHNAGFNLPNGGYRSATVEVSLHSWTGYYGSSSCSTAIHVGDEAVFKNAFITVLNKHFWALLEETADLIEAEARADKDAALAELDELRNLISGE